MHYHAPLLKEMYVTDSPLFENLKEDSLENSIGELSFNDSNRNYIFPFLHDGIPYFAYFATLEDSSEGITREQLQEALKQDAPLISLGETLFFMKFGLAEESDSELMYAKGSQKVKSGMFTRLPQKFKLMVKVLSDKVHFDNLFFIAGSDDVNHQNRLMLWYKRITVKINPIDIGFENFYSNHEAGCYGYKRIN